MYRRLEYYVNAQKRQVDIFFVSDFYFLETIGRSRGRGIGRSSETLKIVQTFCSNHSSGVWVEKNVFFLGEPWFQIHV